MSNEYISWDSPRSADCKWISLDRKQERVACELSEIADDVIMEVAVGVSPCD